MSAGWEWLCHTERYTVKTDPVETGANART